MMNICGDGNVGPDWEGLDSEILCCCNLVGGDFAKAKVIDFNGFLLCNSVERRDRELLIVGKHSVC
jgi:hypothetical protein